MRLVESYLKKAITTEGIRRVPVNVRSLTGEVDGQEFESSLERDFLLLTHWDDRVDWYQTQPFSVDYTDEKGVNRIYTPDVFISYRQIEGHPLCINHTIYEVKYREDLFADWKILKPKFKAARQYAKERNWNFKIVTEKEIRTPFLENVQFLWAYSFASFHVHHFDKLMLCLECLDQTTPKELLEIAYSSKTMRGEALWALWCMIARKWVKCDLSIPLDMHTPIWVDDVEEEDV